MRLVGLYVFFALVATVANIGAQDLSVRVYAGWGGVPLSVFFGTGVGLVVKYLLDKKYIFRYRTRNLAHDGRTFFLYTLAGVVTTLIFWVFEFGFDAVFQTKTLRYVGAVIGLAIGYVVKYRLDKRFVFCDGAEVAVGGRSFLGRGEVDSGSSSDADSVSASASETRGETA